MIQEQNLYLLQNRDNVIQFDITLEGAVDKEPRVRMIVEHNGEKRILECEHIGNSVYNCNVPNSVGQSEPNYILEVISDGFLFEVQKGSMAISDKITAVTNEAKNIDLTQEELEALLEVERKRERLKIEEERLETQQRQVEAKKQQQVEEANVEKESVLERVNKQQQSKTKDKDLHSFFEQQTSETKRRMEREKKQMELDELKEKAGIKKSKFFEFL